MSSLSISVMFCFNVFYNAFEGFGLNLTFFTRSYNDSSNCLSSLTLGAGLVVLNPKVSFLLPSVGFRKKKSLHLMRMCNPIRNNKARYRGEVNSMSSVWIAGFKLRPCGLLSISFPSVFSRPVSECHISQ